MATDMLRLAGESEGFRSETFSNGESCAPPLRRPDIAVAPNSQPRALDLRALVAGTIIPRLRQSLRSRGALPDADAAMHPSRLARVPNAAAKRLDAGQECNAGQAYDPGQERGAGPELDDVDARIGEMIDGLLRDDLAGVCRHIDAVRACGHSLDRIYVELVTPVAVGISHLLAEDLCGSAAGTLAFCNLQLVLRRYASDFYAEGLPTRHSTNGGLRALLVSPRAGAEAMQGLQVFGLLLAADFLRREGWEAWTARSFRSAPFEDAILTQWFDLVEIIATDDDDLDEIASGIRTIRRGGVNPRVRIVACGRLFADHPEYVRLVGADHVVSDPLSSLPHLSRFAKRPLRRLS